MLRKSFIFLCIHLSLHVTRLFEFLKKRHVQLVCYCCQADGRVSTLARQQVIERGSDSPPSVPGETVRIEEKIRRLPVGGEGWETRMKRKRSVATLGNRVMNPDQRVMQPKPTVDSKLRSCDTQNLRCALKI